MLSLVFGVLWGEEMLGERELGLLGSGVLLLVSSVAMAEAWEPDLPGGVGPLLTTFASEEVRGLAERFFSLASSRACLFFFGAMGDT